MSKNQKGGKKGGIVGAGVVAALLLSLFGGYKLGLGDAIGLGPGKQVVDSKDKDTKENKPEDKKDDNKKAELPSEITVKITEDKVFVGDKEFTDGIALKAYIEEINNDKRTYKLVEENSIKATHDWVLQVFDELRLTLK